MKQPDESGPGLRLLFPATVGVYDFDLSEIFEEDLVDQVGMASILPGLEYLIPIRSDTMLKPFVQVGYGTEFSTNGSAFLYAFGARTLSKWERGRTEYLLGTEVQVAGYQTNDDVSSTLSRFGLGGSVIRWPGWSLWERNLNYGGYLIYYRYGNALDFFLGSDEQDVSQSLENQVEVGMTLGVDPEFSALGFSLDRLGLGLIFGENLQGIKLATDFPF